MKKKSVIFTIGHSTRTIDEFVNILKAYRIREIIDIRTVPRSRHVPQFNLDALQQSLPGEGLGYVHMKELGGLRHPVKDSPNRGWRSPSFRGFADYMQTEEFEKGIERLMELAKDRRIAVMCAEAVPWRCHRSLVADALTVRGFEVEHILSATAHRPHSLTPFAVVEGRKITYPPTEQEDASPQ